MSTNKTPNYQLHSWVKEDTFLMDEMNENFATLDGKLHQEVTALDGQLKAEVNARTQQLAEKADKSEVAAKADAATVTALDKTVQSLSTALGGKAQIVVGHYAGNGEKSRTFDLGASVLAVIIETSKGTRDPYSTYGGIGIRGIDGNPYISVSDTGFSVSQYSKDTYDRLNGISDKYLYVAFIASE